ncbi:MAG: hypothetical protein KGO53_09640 [Alphaproteobacteria bacterium]|nr:hypothetical protein [Alphaproteobacteria bacterium]
MRVIHLAKFDASSRSATLARLLHDSGLGPAHAHADAGQKPFLETPEGEALGLAIAHCRAARPPFSVMAVAETPLLGLDVELWPKAADPALLAAVAAPEDAPLAARISALGHDPATFLWVAKEAALKASGEVMLDPRQIALTPSPNGHYLAASSASASAPMAETAVRLWRFSGVTGAGLGLLALAVLSPADTAWRNPARWQVESAGLPLEPVM